MVSEKIHNYDYAPGVATYGITGKTGATGAPGNSLFYTNYNIYSNRDDLKKFLYKILYGVLPISTSTDNDKIGRAYQNNDYFFDNIGNIYKLYNIDAINNSTNTSELYSTYLKLCGKINIKDDSALWDINDAGRLTVNTDYTGVDIIDNINNFSYDKESPYTLRILSDNPDSLNRITFILFNAIYGANLNTNFNIYYDTVLNTYHAESDVPILVDAELKIANNNTYDDSYTYDGYSPVLTNDNTITSFYNLINQLIIKFYQSDTDEGKCSNIYLNILELTGNYKILYDNIKDYIKIKIVYNVTSDEGSTINNGQYTYITKIEKYLDFLNNKLNILLRDADIEILSVSYIYNIEVYGKAYWVKNNEPYLI